MVAVPDMRFVVRVEYDEWRLLEERPELYDAVLIKAAYLAPYHEKHPHRGRDPRRLAHAVPHDRELWYDPDTAGLFSRTSAKLPEISRICSTPLAHEFRLPIDLSLLARSSQLRDRAVDISLEDQVGSATLIRAVRRCRLAGRHGAAAEPRHAPPRRRCRRRRGGHGGDPVTRYRFCPACWPKWPAPTRRPGCGGCCSASAA